MIGRKWTDAIVIAAAVYGTCKAYPVAEQPLYNFLYLVVLCVGCYGMGYLTGKGTAKKRQS